MSFKQVIGIFFSIAFLARNLNGTKQCAVNAKVQTLLLLSRILSRFYGSKALLRE